MRAWVGTLILAGVAVYLSRFLSARELSDQSIVRTLQPKIQKVDGEGITVSTELVVDNPTNRSLTLTKPVVRLSSAGQFIASSRPEGKLIQIEPLTRTSLERVEITLPWQALGNYASGLLLRIPGWIAQFQSTGGLNLQSLAIPLEYSYSTYINGAYIESTPIQLV